MRYAFEIQSDGTRDVYVFGDEPSRIKWIAASPASRGILSGNSREVKAALYRDTVIVTSVREKEISASFMKSHLSLLDASLEKQS